jgi:hypothetical protein
VYILSLQHGMGIAHFHSPKLSVFQSEMEVDDAMGSGIPQTQSQASMPIVHSDISNTQRM